MWELTKNIVENFVCFIYGGAGAGSRTWEPDLELDLCTGSSSEPKSTGSGFGSATLDTIPIKIRYFLCRIRIGPFQYKSQNLAPFHPNLIKGDQRRSGCEHTEY